MEFSQLNLIEPILKAVQANGYTEATPIQAQAIPVALEGKDILGCAQTGTGKTAAFSLPILQRLALNAVPVQGKPLIRALILSPTRELATQIGENIGSYSQFLNINKQTKLKHTVIFGGVNQSSQVHALRNGVDILVATPGRLLDLMGQGYVDLDFLEILVLDEADRMLDMGFIADIRKIIRYIPDERQTLFFSATMPRDIQSLADSMLNNPVKIEVTPVSSTVDLVDQHVYFVERTDKKNLLLDLIKAGNMGRVLIFTRTKSRADLIVRSLNQARIRAEAIHSNKSQNARQTALDNFKGFRTKVLVATDIASRGIDVDDITHVINFDLPNVPETYVHRIGRTGRAGASGIAFSFCDSEEQVLLRDIERLTGRQLSPVSDHSYHSTTAAAVLNWPAVKSAPHRQGQPSRGQGGGNNANGGNSGGNHGSSLQGMVKRRRRNRPKRKPIGAEGAGAPQQPSTAIS